MHDTWWSRVDSCGHQDTAQGELGYYCEPLSTNTVTCVLSLQTFTNHNMTHRWKYSLRRRENPYTKNMPPHATLRQNWGGGICLNIQLVLCICPLPHSSQSLIRVRSTVGAFWKNGSFSEHVITGNLSQEASKQIASSW